MPDLATIPAIPGMSDGAIVAVREYEERALTHPQAAMRTWHQLHAGIYSRTIFIPAGIEITGALVKIPTTLIVSGDVMFNLGDGWARFKGYGALAASAHRKQVFQALADTWLTMHFCTEAKTSAEAEAEFTDEHDRLWSRRGENFTLITGE